jgi:hypothetical protein
MEKVRYDGGCWIFTAAKDPNGYGRFGGGKLAHRVAYKLLAGGIPDGMALDHLCRTPACINPLHLEPVTQAENVRRGKDGNAWRKAKTHCPKGHEYTAENVRLRPGNRRECRECGRIYERNRAAERRS